MSQRALKLGTRRSALARAQSATVARELERMHPGLSVELVGIETRGDRILDRPLAALEGKEFFTAELDAALLDGSVDCTVHSCKDLSLDRTARLCLAAVPRRTMPHDVVIFAADAPARAAAGQTLLLGSASPRRASFVPALLERVLPAARERDDGGERHAPRVWLQDLRGNVDTRLRRLHEPQGAPRHLDGVVLALAGLARLWADEAGRELLGPLIAGLPRMALPLSRCPAAPAQGALAVECRREDRGTLRLLEALEHGPSRAAVERERALLAERGGGCHQRFGATQIELTGLGALLYVRDADEQGAREPQLRWYPPQPLLRPPGRVVAWDGSREIPAAPEPIAGAAARAADALAHAPALFIAHRRSLPVDVPAAALAKARHVWVPGIETWAALARRGLWVEGCADGLGFAALEPLVAEPVLGLPPAPQWSVLTHEAAVPGWPAGSAIATYRHAAAAPAWAPGASVPSADGPPGDVTHVYWHSAEQYRRFGSRLPAGVAHACGPGKTGEQLREQRLETLTIFPSAVQWRQWLGL